MAWPNSQQRTVELEISTTNVDSTLTNFPVLITRANLPDEMCSPTDSNAAQSDGGDIRVGDDTSCTTQYAIEVVQFEHDSTDGAGDADVEIWVKVPSVSATVGSETTFALGYNTSGTTSADAVTATYGRNAVWADYEAVYHLDSTTDSTGNGHGLTATGATAGDIAAPWGTAGGATSFSGTNQYMLAADDLGAGGVETDVTIQAWVYSDGRPAATEFLFGFQDSGGSGGRYTACVAAYNTSPSRRGFWHNGTSSGQKAHAATPDGNAWRQEAFTIDASGTADYLWYLDGAQPTQSVATTLVTGTMRTSSTFSLGRDEGDTARDLTGRLDEARVRFGILSAAWLKAEYANQNSPTGFLSQVTTTTLPDVSGYTYRRAITVNNRTGGALTNYPVRVWLTASNFDFSKAETDGEDLRVTDSGGSTQLSMWKEEYDSGAADEAKLWFKATTLATGSNTFYLYYGKSGDTDGDDPAGVFDYYNPLSTTDDLVDLDGVQASGTWSVVTDAGSPTGNAVNASASSVEVGRYIAHDFSSTHYVVEMYTANESGATNGAWAGPFMNRADDDNWFRGGSRAGSNSAGVLLVRNVSGTTTSSIFKTNSGGAHVDSTYYRGVSLYHPEITETGSTDIDCSSLTGNLQGLTYDPASNKLYATTSSQIARIDPNGTINENVTNNPGGTSWGDCHVLSGTLYVVRFDGTTSTTIYSFDPADLAAGATLEATLTSDFDDNGANALVHDGTNWLIGETGTNAANPKLHVFNNSWVQQSEQVLPMEGDSATNYGMQGFTIRDDTLYIAYHGGIMMAGPWDTVNQKLELAWLHDTGLSDLQGIAWNEDDSVFYIMNRSATDIMERTFTEGATNKTISTHWRGDRSAAVAHYTTTSPNTQDEIGIGCYRDARFAQMVVRAWANPEPLAIVGSEENTSGGGTVHPHFYNRRWAA